MLIVIYFANLPITYLILIELYTLTDIRLTDSQTNTLKNL